MKKLLSMAAVAVLLSTGASAVDTITLQATVAPAATVQLQTAFTASDLTSGTGVFNDYAMASRTTVPLGAETDLVDENVYLQSNGAAESVMMQLDFTTLTGATVASETITLNCYYDAAATAATTAVTTATPFSLTSAVGTNDGTATVGQLRITGTTTDNQVAQDYDGTVTVTITPA